MIRVLLAGPPALTRGALAALLAREEDIEVGAELNAVSDIVVEVRTLRPDVALIDIDGEGGEDLDGVGELHMVLPECRTVLLTGSREPERLRRALAVESWGLIGKNAP